MILTRHNAHSFFHFTRSRLNNLFMEAVKYPLTLICAGAGYGKTTAVHDFAEEYQELTVWVQLSERDNVGGRFWENFTHSMTQVNPPFARAINKLGFPETSEKLNQYYALLGEYADNRRRVLVFDDCHCINNPAVIRFLECDFRKLLPGSSLFLLSRSTPLINIAGLVSSDQIFNVSEDELGFTDSELSQYFRQMDISLQPDSLHEIMHDTNGWSFAINLIAHSYQKAPGYRGYLRNAMKTNIFRFMETEVWDTIREPVQNFLVRLSLIDHLSVDLIALLAGAHTELIDELERQNAYVRRDSYINAYLIHPLFLEFLSTKKHLLSEEQQRETYTIAGEWCNKNGFKIDALSYYEKIGDYKAITGIFLGSRSQMPYDIACYAAAIFERAPPEVFDTVIYLAPIHMRAVMCQGRWEDVIKLARYYEDRYTKLPKDDEFRKHILGSIYYRWGITRNCICLVDDTYDFDLYFDKVDKCFSEPDDPGILINKNPEGLWTCFVGSSRKGAPDDYLAALKRSMASLEHCYTGFNYGKYELACGELLFYKNDIDAAEAYFICALSLAQERKQYGIIHRVLFYILRIAVFRGNYTRATQALKDMKANLDKTEYYNRFIDYDISLCWYYCALGLCEKVPDWLKEDFALYVHAGFIENFANQMKARYCYAIRNYLPLLLYIEDMKKRESFLFGRIEMLAMEACVHYKMKDRKKAYAVLEEAYAAASPNDILMPFAELGKDMRALTASVLKESAGNLPGGIPAAWLEKINQKAAFYARRQGHVVAEYKQANGIAGGIAISPREREILIDLTHGLTRTDIASSHGLSINTVKMLISSIHSKMGAENLVDAVRIAAESKVI